MKSSPATRPRSRSSRMKKKQTSAGGIVLPGSAQEKPNQGEVVAVGSRPQSLDSGERPSPSHVKVGDTVVFGQYAGSMTPSRSMAKS